jgi:uncharacterized protein (TIRG00374 family)
MKKRILLLLVSAFGVSLLLAVYSDVSVFLSAVASFDVKYLPAILMMAPLNYVFRFVKWSVYLKLIRVRLKTRDSVLIFLSGLAMTVTPGKVGELLKSYMIKEKYGVPISCTASMIVAERVTDGISMLILAFMGFSVLRYGLRALSICGIATCLGVLFVRNRSLCLAILKSMSRIRVLRKTAGVLENMYSGTYELFKLAPFLFAVAIGVVSWSFEGVIVYLALLAFGSHVSLMASLFVVAFSSIMGAVSMLPGGLLAAEVSIVSVLIQLGVTPAIASGTAIISRISTLWLGVLIGLVAMFFASRAGFFIQETPSAT